MSVGTLMKHNECTMCGECRVAGGWRRRRTSSLRLFMWAGSASLTKASRIAFTLACFSSSETRHKDIAITITTIINSSRNDSNANDRRLLLTLALLHLCRHLSKHSVSMSA
jgi:hypothetical protein